MIKDRFHKGQKVCLNEVGLKRGFIQSVMIVMNPEIDNGSIRVDGQKCSWGPGYINVDIIEPLIPPHINKWKRMMAKERS